MFTFEQALAYHLQHRHFPAVPAALAVPCREAIDAASAGDWDEPIDLRGIAEWRGEAFAPAWAVVEGYHLEAFLPYDDDYLDLDDIPNIAWVDDQLDDYGDEVLS